MKVWVLKAIIQKTISFLPFKSSINYVFQKYVTKGVYLTDEYFYDRLGHAKVHLSFFKKYSNNSNPKTCLELGTGWYPVVPIALFLSGTDKIYSVDISLLTNKKRIETTLFKFIESLEKGNLSTYINIVPDRLAILRQLILDYNVTEFSAVLSVLHLTYLIEDARKLSLKDNSIDLVNSNNTFEHIYPEILKPILSEFKRVVSKQNGVMSHFIDMSDHFAHFDKSISVYNFLKFSDAQWKWIDNNIQPQSRLRMNDYKKIYSELNIPLTEETHRDGSIEQLKGMNLDKKFIANPIADTAITHCHFVTVFEN